MRLVTYDGGAGPRVGLLEDGVVSDVGFDGDMVGFIEAGAPVTEPRAAGSDVEVETPGGELPPGEDESYALEPGVPRLELTPRPLPEAVGAYVDWLRLHPAAQGRAEA